MTVTMASAAPTFSWENLRVNDDLGRVEGAVNASAVRAHAFAIGDDPERYMHGIGTTGPVVPPALLINDLLKLFLLGYDCTRQGSAGGLHTKALIEYVAPLPIGDAVIITGTHIAKYRRRGRNYRSCLSQAVRADGTVLARMLATETVGYAVTDAPDEGDVPANWASGRPRVDGVIPAGGIRAQIGRPVLPGMVLGPIERSVSLEQSVIFSGYPFGWARETPVALRQGLHTNPDVARDSGYPVPVAQGLVSAAHLTSLLLDYYGERVFRGAQLAFSFIGPVLVGTTLQSHAIGEDDCDIDGRRFSTLRMASKNADGKLVTVGYARVPQ